MGKKNASDLYLTVGCPPTLRAPSGLSTIGEKAIENDHVNAILSTVLSPKQLMDFEKDMEANTSLDMGEHGRFRINAMKQRQQTALVIRRIVTEIPNFEQLKLPPIYADLIMERRGLILVVGMTGSGKSTSLASMIDYRNTKESGHIVTIEDPIEYYHEHKKSIVTQREVGVDTHSYASALKNALRQRPDVILVGEVRDRDVMEQALTASETGHLCLATIHANNAYQAIERVVNFFPKDQITQVRMNLAANLKAILSQRLIPSKDGALVPVLEVMLNQGLIRELILKGEINKIRDVMEENTMLGMRSFDQSLVQLYRAGLITEEVAISHSDRASDMKMKIHKVKFLDEEHGGKHALLQNVDTSFLRLKE
jgi:twitching motility protein PilU